MPVAVAISNAATSSTTTRSETFTHVGMRRAYETFCLRCKRCVAIRTRLLVVPRLWQETIDAHRDEVRDAIVHAVAALAADGGLRAVTMSKIAERAGIGRATLYRYFPDVDAVLMAWHETQIRTHVAQLAAIAERADRADRLAAVLEAFAFLSQHSHGHHDADIEAFLHRDPRIDRARGEVTALVAQLVADAARHGLVRDDVAADELARYCLHALGAAQGMTSKAAIRRLVSVTLAGLRRAAK